LPWSSSTCPHRADRRRIEAGPPGPEQPLIDRGLYRRVRPPIAESLPDQFRNTRPVSASAWLWPSLTNTSIAFSPWKSPVILRVGHGGPVDLETVGRRSRSGEGGRGARLPRRQDHEQKRPGNAGPRRAGRLPDDFGFGFMPGSTCPAAWSAVRQHSRRGQSEGATSPRMGVMTGTIRADCEITVDHAATAGRVRRCTV
jgi:hypothetical protein